MDLWQARSFRCPYCASRNSFTLESGQEETAWVQDCEVCCQPIVIAVRTARGEILDIRVDRENF